MLTKMLTKQDIPIFFIAILFIISIILLTSVKAADHIDWPQGTDITFNELDIGDVYAWVPQKGKLTLALDLHFNANETTKFSSEDVVYRFRLRAVRLNETKGTNVVVPQVVSEAPEVTVSCTVHREIATCSTPGYSVYSKLGHITEFKQRAPLQLFAGTVMDPFFIDVLWLQTRAAESDSAFDPNSDPNYIGPVPLENPINLVDSMGVLNITVVLDINDILGDEYQYYAVAADVVVNGVIFERMGRPGINNLIMRTSSVDVLDDYNGSDTYNLTPEEVATYKAHLSTGVAGWDKLDKKTDWKPNDKAALVETLLLDTLIINVKNKCDFKENPIFDIERSAGPLKHYAKKCGGRTPLADGNDTMVSLIVAGPHVLKDLYGDGVDRNRIQPTQEWPYFILFDPKHR